MQDERLGERREKEQQADSISKFVETHNGVQSTLKRKAGELGGNGSNEVNSSSYLASRVKYIDDTDRKDKMEQLSKVCPWVPQFTPHAADAVKTAPPKRPASPFSGRPLRSKDLIPIDLIKESSGSENSSIVKYLCPVSRYSCCHCACMVENFTFYDPTPHYKCTTYRKTITNQKVILIKTTGAMMIEQAAKDLAFPTMTCPITGKRFAQADVVELVAAHSGNAACGGVEGKVHKPSMN